jgi:UDP-2,3-diacylglucosamine pyrophosphatase LpxH
VCREAVHVTADGRRLLVIHGDEYDTVVACAKWLAVLGSGAYDFTILLNRWLNAFRLRMGFPYWSLSQYLKHKVKNAMMFVADYEHALVAGARKRGLNGVVCGHIHRPGIREIDGISYYNTGDWVESCTALVEHFDGRMEIIEWRHQPQSSRRRKVKDVPRNERYEDQRMAALM